MYTYNAKITAVYDGDTVTADIDCGFQIWKKGEKLRLFGINTPEVRGDAREEGLKSRNFLRSLILNKKVEVHTVKDKKGKYGRYLATIFLNGKNINEFLVEKGYGEFKDY